MSVPRIRSSKACEACRRRRIRCSGPPPCDACVEGGKGSACVVRLKARPHRVPRIVQSKTVINRPIVLLSEPELELDGDIVDLHHQSHFSDVEDQFGSINVPADEQAAEVRAELLDTSLQMADTDKTLSPISIPRRPFWIAPTPASPVDTSPSLTTHPPKTSAVSPLVELEVALRDWCTRNNLDVASVSYRDDSRLAKEFGTPLPVPWELQNFEDALFNYLSFVADIPLRDGLVTDFEWSASLYQRYRKIPASLTDDQRAIIYAMLCMARFAQIRTELNSTANSPILMDTSRREDITYYHMALDCLNTWDRASMAAAKALMYLNTFTVGAGSPADTKTIQIRMAWQISSLGLHQRSLLDLYSEKERDQGATYVAAFFYTDLFRAVLTDLSPSLPLSESSLVSLTPFGAKLLRPSSSCTAQFLSEFANQEVDTQSREYVTRTEAQWREKLSQLRCSGRSRDVYWADFRFNWLRILLYIPLLPLKGTVPEAPSVIVRCVSRILHTYYDLIAIQELNPSWPQIVRLVACGQLLILMYSAGELQRREGRTLFSMLLDLLSMHKGSWPECNSLIQGFTAAADALDVNLTPDPSSFASSSRDAESLSQPYLIGQNTAGDDYSNAAVVGDSLGFLEQGLQSSDLEVLGGLLMNPLDGLLWTDFDFDLSAGAPRE